MLFAALLSACTFENSFEGTWFFLFDLESETEGDCVTQDTGWGADTGETTYDGTTADSVNIYSTGAGKYLVYLGYSEPLVGEAQGSDLAASYEVTESSANYRYTEKYELDGTLKSGELSGKYVTTTDVDYNGTPYKCTTTQRYTAMRSTTTLEEQALAY